MRSRIVLAGSALLASLLLAGAPLPAAAGARPHRVGPYKVKALRVLSGPSPFAAGCPGARFDDTAIAGYELGQSRPSAAGHHHPALPDTEEAL